MCQCSSKIKILQLLSTTSLLQSFPLSPYDFTAISTCCHVMVFQAVGATGKDSALTISISELKIHTDTVYESASMGVVSRVQKQLVGVELYW